MMSHRDDVRPKTAPRPAFRFARSLHEVLVPVPSSALATRRAAPAKASLRVATEARECSTAQPHARHVWVDRAPRDVTRAHCPGVAASDDDDGGNASSAPPATCTWRMHCGRTTPHAAHVFDHFTKKDSVLVECSGAGVAGAVAAAAADDDDDGIEALA